MTGERRLRPFVLGLRDFAIRDMPPQVLTAAAGDIALDVTNLALFRHWVLLSRAKNLSGEANRKAVAAAVCPRRSIAGFRFRLAVAPTRRRLAAPQRNSAFAPMSTIAASSLRADGRSRRSPVIPDRDAQASSTSRDGWLLSGIRPTRANGRVSMSAQVDFGKTVQSG